MKSGYYFCIIIAFIGAMLFAGSILARYAYIPSTDLVSECTKEIVTIEEGPICTQLKDLYSTVMNMAALGFALTAIFLFVAWKIDYNKLKRK